jgi:oligopeptide transport system substrate-binding protein
MYNKLFVLLKTFFYVFFISTTLYAATNTANTIKVAISSDPKSLDPNYSSGTWEHYLFVNIYEGLVHFNNEGKVIPGMAESWTVSNGGKTYTFKIRENAKWSDGKPVVAEDFVVSFKRVLDPATGASYASSLHIIKGGDLYNSGKGKEADVKIRAINAKTLEIELNHPAAYFIEMLEHPIFYPIPAHIFKKHGKNWVKLENIVFNGAYKVTSWTVKSHLNAVRNPYYYDIKNISIENVVFSTQSDDNAVLDSFRAKELDIAYNFPISKLEVVKKELDGEYYISDYSGLYYYSLNLVKNKAFQDKRVRKALTMAINREILVEKITGSGEKPAYSYIPSALYGKGATYPEFDFKKLTMKERIVEAKKLMEEAGYTSKKPLQIRLSYNTSEAHKKVATAITNMWADLGVVVKTETADVNIHFDNLHNANFDVGRAGWVADYQEPSTFLEVFITGGVANYSGYSDAKFDELNLKGRATLNEVDRFSLYKQAEAIAIDFIPVIPLYFYTNRMLASKRVIGFKPNITGVYNVKYFKLAK